MPGNQAAAAAAPIVFSDGGDDGFGDFEFVSSSLSPSPILFPDNSTSEQSERWGEDDEWGDFLAVPLGSRPSNPQSLFDPFPGPNQIPPASSSKTWERSMGALPLSIFGDEEDEEPESSSHSDRPFSSHSQRPARDGIGSGPSGDLKDLIKNLYGHPPVPAPAGSNGAVPDLGLGDDDLDWEFKDAFSTETGAKKEGFPFETTGFENKAAVNGNGTEVGNRSRESQEATGQCRDDNAERDLSDVYVIHDGFTNGLDCGSVVVDHSYHVSETNQLTKYISNGNGLQTGLENGDKNDDDNVWKFMDALSEFEDVTGSLGNQKIPDTEAEVLVPIVEIQGTRNIWENNLGDSPPSSFSNGKKDSGGPFEDHNWLSCEPMAVRTNCYPSVAPNDIISNLYDKSDQIYNVYPAQNRTENGPKSAELGPHSTVVNDASDFDEMHWEFQKASDTTVIDQCSVLKLDKSLSTESTQNSYLDLYCKLQEECLALIAHHLDDLKKAHEVATISGEQAKVIKIDEEIQAAYKKLQEAKISENDCIIKHPSSDMHVGQLLDFIKQPNVQALEQEYCLQERIFSAEKDLSAAIELFEHTVSVLQILGIASEEEHHTYIIAWTEMALACAQELHHGAAVWEESIRANLDRQILSRGNRYFVALAEIYRVSEILRVSLKLYKPWVLSSRGDSSELLTSLGKCAEAWETTGLEKALEHEDGAKLLLESIKLIRDLDERTLQNLAFSHGEIICKLSLLPMGILQGMKAVEWEGGHYCLKLANMWANRVSCHPPQLPHIRTR